MRSEARRHGAIASIPLHLIAPFLNEAVVVDADELARAPRIVAAQEGRVLIGRGDTAYVRGDLEQACATGACSARRRPLVDPATKESSATRRAYVGTAEHVRQGEARAGADGKPKIVPATFA